jgi:hypothetical protein
MTGVPVAVTAATSLCGLGMKLAPRRAAPLGFGSRAAAVFGSARTSTAALASVPRPRGRPAGVARLATGPVEAVAEAAPGIPYRLLPLRQHGQVRGPCVAAKEAPGPSTVARGPRNSPPRRRNVAEQRAHPDEVVEERAGSRVTDRATSPPCLVLTGSARRYGSAPGSARPTAGSRLPRRSAVRGRRLGRHGGRATSSAPPWSRPAPPGRASRRARPRRRPRRGRARGPAGRRPPLPR